MARLGRRQPIRPLVNRLIQYQPVPPPPAASPLPLRCFAALHFRQHARIVTRGQTLTVESFAVTVLPPVPLTLVAVVKAAIAEADRQARLPRQSRYALPKILHTPIVRVQPPFTVHHDEDAPQRSRRNQQQVTSVLNGLLRNGELIGSLTDPALGYKADNPLQWAGAGDGDPKSLHDVIERFLAALNGLGIKP
jgi:hypothetical protein